MKKVTFVLTVFLLVGLAVTASAKSLRGQLRQLTEALLGATVTGISRPKGVETVGDPAEPNAIIVPANTSTRLVCGSVGGVFKCWQASVQECPSTVVLVSDSKDVPNYECDLDCGNTPGGEPVGNECDCDVRYDTCRAL